jgi:hypothetical protein
MEFSLLGIAMGAMESDLRANVQQICRMVEENNRSAGFDLAPGHNKCAVNLNPLPLQTPKHRHSERSEESLQGISSRANRRRDFSLRSE